MIEEWQRGIKFLADADELKNCTVPATGSQALKILEGGEHLSGRMGRTADPHNKLLLPMKFSEFIEVCNKEITQFMHEHRLFKGDTRKEMLRACSQRKFPKR